jgi:hypothetical protein
MESFSRLLNYPGNVKAAIICKIVRIVFAKFLRLPVIGARRRGNPLGFFARGSQSMRAAGVLQLDEAARASPN